MRFFKSFSLLHRRTKSDSAAKYMISKPQTPSRPQSAPNFSSLNEAPVVPPNAIFSSAVPWSSPVITSPIALPEGAIPILTRPTLGAANARILELETENKHLKDTTHAMASQFAALRAELLDARSDLFAELHKDQSRIRQTKADEEEIYRCEEKLSQYEKFIGLMINIGQHAEPVLSRAHAALRAGEDADVALIDSIKEAAAKPGTPWESIVSSVIGPRAPAQYVSALNLTLKSRKELKQCRKVAKFWKRMAQKDSQNADIITPSNSDMSSIHELLGRERQAAVDALLAKYPRTALRLNNGNEQKPNLLPPSFGTADEIHKTYVAPSATTDTFPHVYDSTPTISSVYVLPPLASVSFKQELAASYSFNKHFPKRTFAKGFARTVLGDVNLNTTPSSNITPSESSLSQGSRMSADALEERRAVTNAHSAASIRPSIRSVLRLPEPDSTECARDLFASALSASLLTVCEDRTASEINPSGTTSANHWTRSAFDTFAFDRPSSIEENFLKLGEQANTGLEQLASAPSLDFSIVAETISTAPTSPSKTPEVTLSKSSRLPVLKSIRRLSPKALTAEFWTKKTTSPPVIKKPAILTKSPAISTPTPSRLPLFKKAVPIKISLHGKENVMR